MLVFIRVSEGIVSVPTKVVNPSTESGTVALQDIVTPVVGLDKVIAVVVSPVRIVWFSCEKLTKGDGSTLILKVSLSPIQLTPLLTYVGVTVITPSICSVVALLAVKLRISPVPLEAKPIAGLLFVQEYIVDPGDDVFELLKFIPKVESPLQSV